MEKSNWKEVIKNNLTLFIIIVAISFGVSWFVHNKVDVSNQRKNSYKYTSCLNECYDAQMTSTQESICLNGCIDKYK